MSVFAGRSKVPVKFDTIDFAIDGFLARFSSACTRDAYQGDLQLWRSWCEKVGIENLLEVERGHIEMFARYLETERGNSASSVHRRLVCLRSFYRVLSTDGLVPFSPADGVRLPRLSTDRTQYVHVTRGELSSLLHTADRAKSPTDGALFALMGILGLRVSEACSLNVDCADGYQRGHRILPVLGKGGTTTGIPVPVQVGRRIDLARGDRRTGPLLARRDGSRMNRDSAGLVVDRIVKKAGLQKKLTPHDLRAAAITCALDSGISLRDVQTMARHSDPRTTEIYDRARNDIDRHGAYILASYLAA